MRSGGRRGNQRWPSGPLLAQEGYKCPAPLHLTARDGPESLLACRVPDLKLDEFIIHIHFLNLEVDAVWTTQTMAELERSIGQNRRAHGLTLSS